MYARYLIGSDELVIVPRNAGRIRSELPESFAIREGLHAAIEGERRGEPWSFGAYADASLVAFSVGYVNIGNARAYHCLVERVRDGPRGAGTLVFAHDGLALSMREDLDAWALDAPNPRIAGLVSGLGYREEPGSDPPHYTVPLSTRSERSRLREGLDAIVRAILE